MKVKTQREEEEPGEMGGSGAGGVEEGVDGLHLDGGWISAKRRSRVTRAEARTSAFKTAPYDRGEESRT